MSCPVVSTSKGKIKGRIVNLNCRDGKPVCVYRNIPFAKPPVGELRFLPPKPADAWEGVRDGTALSKQPMQSFQFDKMMGMYFPFKRPEGSDFVGHEDCLYLTVYTPAAAKGKKLPVMMWIYGGGFQYGSDLPFNGSALAGLNDVIVVVPNYRVSVFGFLSLGQGSVCPGNAGQLDQIMALKWIRDDVGCFGGDKNNVTIFGESSGGMSVDLHLISPLSKGLFHRAMSQSGQAIMPGLFNDEERSKKINQTLMKKLGIVETKEKDVLAALQKIPPSDLVRVAEEMSEKDLMNFNPTIDGKHICKHPEQYYRDRDFSSRVPYIVGCNNTEGQGLAGIFSGPNFFKGMTEEESKKIPLPWVNEEIFYECKKFYMKEETDDKRFSKLLGDIVGGSMAIGPAIRAATTYAEAGAEVYVFQGAFQLKMFHDEKYGKDVGKKPDWCICDHDDDTHMFLGFPFVPGEAPFGAKYSKEEEILSRRCMAYITNFAKHGDPNKGIEVEKIWPKYKPGGENIILDHVLRVGNTYPSEEVEFWTKITQKLAMNTQS